jgi:hypothetical protein
MMFCCGTQVKGCFAEADTGERMVCYSRHVKGWVTFRRNINMTPQTVGAGALVCSASLRYSSLTAHMYWFTLHCIVELSWWWLDRNLTKNFSWGSCSFLLLLWPRLVGEPCGFFWIELPLLILVWYLLSGLVCSCWIVSGDCWMD